MKTTRQLVIVIAALLALTLFTFTSALAQEVTLEPTANVVTATPDAVIVPVVDAPTVETIETTPIVAGIVAIVVSVIVAAGIAMALITQVLLSIKKTDEARFNQVAAMIPPSVLDAYRELKREYVTLSGVVDTVTDFIPGNIDNEVWLAVKNALATTNGNADALIAILEQTKIAARALTPTDSGNAVG